jgi:Flp pilus assembly pilin Flp
VFNVGQRIVEQSPRRTTAALSVVIAAFTSCFEEVAQCDPSLRIDGTGVAKVKAHRKCCRDSAGAITQDSWDDACILCALLPGQLFLSGYDNNPNTRGETSMQKIMNFINDESGMETLEYALIAGLIAIVAVAVYASGWGTALTTRLNDATTAGPAIP